MNEVEQAIAQRQAERGTMQVRVTNALEAPMAPVKKHHGLPGSFNPKTLFRTSMITLGVLSVAFGAAAYKHWTKPAAGVVSAQNAPVAQHKYPLYMKRGL